MNVIVYAKKLLDVSWSLSHQCISRFSTTTSAWHDKRTWRKKWVTPSNWAKLKSGDDTIPWVDPIPQRFHKDHWTREEACFGMYDYLPILGNDVTISHKLFCRGPGYVRAFKGNELQRLIVKRKQLGHRMHAEDLHTINKRIKWLLKFENQVRTKTHG